jgi:catechol 2,3-dioxygenase-like lactoylglutathione lyase family enzyme
MADKLSRSPVWPTLAVKNLKKSRDFYEGILGYKPMMEAEDAVTYKGEGDTGLTIYPSEENAGTNKATYASWVVDNLYETIGDLKQQGVEFEDYDQPGLKTEDGVATMTEGDKTLKAAWFKDPDGNILNILEM